jgi:hypothetical protein
VSEVAWGHLNLAALPALKLVPHSGPNLLLELEVGDQRYPSDRLEDAAVLAKCLRQLTLVVEPAGLCMRDAKEVGDLLEGQERVTNGDRGMHPSGIDGPELDQDRFRLSWPLFRSR